MFKLSANNTVVEISSKTISPAREDAKLLRPEVVDAKVYKLKSAFIKNSVFVTLSYIKYEEQIRPIEIFINSKDLTRAPEYVVLTRLISAIFRRSPNPLFILEELQGIFDPNGGSFKEGKYYHSFYAEIADVIESFFFDVGIMENPENTVSTNVNMPVAKPMGQKYVSENASFKICPDCDSKTLKTESGCDSCMACGYSKCDK
jgi:ribonucleoside-diphosphate reductase alpha chain